MKPPESRLTHQQSTVATDYTPTVGMFITVKFGNNESLLCNPSCAVVNLLSSIKRRAGYANSNVLVDLSDETGEILKVFMN